MDSLTKTLMIVAAERQGGFKGNQYTGPLHPVGGEQKHRGETDQKIAEADGFHGKRSGACECFKGNVTVGCQ